MAEYFAPCTRSWRWRATAQSRHLECGRLPDEPNLVHRALRLSRRRTDRRRPGHAGDGSGPALKSGTSSRSGSTTPPRCTPGSRIWRTTGMPPSERWASGGPGSGCSTWPPRPTASTTAACRCTRSSASKPVPRGRASCRRRGDRGNEGRRGDRDLRLALTGPPALPGDDRHLGESRRVF